MHKIIESKGHTWLHFPKIAEEDLAFLESKYKFHSLDYEDIRDDTPLPKLDVYKHYAFCIFHVPVFNKTTGTVGTTELYVFLSKDTLITMTRKRVPVVDQFAKKLAKASKLRAALIGKGTAFFLYKILLAAFRDALPLVKTLSTDVARLEGEVEHGHGRKTTVELGRVRRNVLYLRHIVAPQEKMLETLSRLDTSFFPQSNALYFDDIHDTLTTMSLTSENLKLIIDGLFDINEALLSHKTNAVVTLLTIISGSLMAPALIAGFYGMNVPWLPQFRNPWFVGAVFAISFFGVIFAMMLITRRKR